MRRATLLLLLCCCWASSGLALAAVGQEQSEAAAAVGAVEQSGTGPAAEPATAAAAAAVPQLQHQQQALSSEEEEDDSVRCRVSGICEGPPPPEACTRVDASPSAEAYRALGLEERDALLGCTAAPEQRAAWVAEAVGWSWRGYRECAWGWDELRPLSCGGGHWLNLSLTLVDSLDTLYLAGLKDEFAEAAHYAVERLDVAAPGAVNLFETTIRILGGLLSAHYLSRESHPALAEGLRAKAAELGERLLPAFSSPSGIPYSDVNLRTGEASSPRWAKISSLSEISTLSLEFTHLARLTGQSKFEDAALGVHSRLSGFVEQYGGLLPLYFNPETGQKGRVARNMGSTVTLGARADSYYEYLLKQWLLTGKKDDLLLERYKHAMRSVRRRLVHRTAAAAAGGLVFVSELEGAAKDGVTRSSKMDHLVCFLPGLLALGDFHGVDTSLQAPPSSSNNGLGSSTSSSSSKTGSSGEEGSAQGGAEAEAEAAPAAATAAAAAKEEEEDRVEEVHWAEGLSDLELAEALAVTCYEMYRRTPTGLAPEIVHFTDREDELDYPKHHLDDVGHGHFSIKPADAHNLLRPEAVESLYVLWKVTGRQCYRDWAWAVFRAFQRWSRVQPGDAARFAAAAAAAKGPGPAAQRAQRMQQVREQAREQQQRLQQEGQGGEGASDGPGDAVARRRERFFRAARARGLGVEPQRALHLPRQLRKQPQQQPEEQAAESVGQEAGGAAEQPAGGAEQPSEAEQEERAELEQGLASAVGDGPAEEPQPEGAAIGEPPEEQQQEQQQQGEEAAAGEQQLGNEAGGQLQAPLQGAAEAVLSAIAQQAQQGGQAEAAAAADGGATEGAGGKGEAGHGDPQAATEAQAAAAAAEAAAAAAAERAAGYCNLQSVVSVPPPRQDKMESFWVAETLKYLYLTFAEPPERCLEEPCGSAGSGEDGSPGGGDGGSGSGRTLISFERFVYNTEAHPLPLVGPPAGGASAGQQQAQQAQQAQQEQQQFHEEL